MEAMRYVVHYADGSVAEIPMNCGQQTGDWWIKNNALNSMDARVAWSNAENKGFFVYGWKNPHPDKTIETLDIVSSNRGPIPVTIGITVEKP